MVLTIAGPSSSAADFAALRSWGSLSACRFRWLGSKPVRVLTYWAQLKALGHEVRLVPPSYVKPYVKRSENDAIDPEALTSDYIPQDRFPEDVPREVSSDKKSPDPVSDSGVRRLGRRGTALFAACARGERCQWN
jgi:hypothetical protein